MYDNSGKNQAVAGLVLSIVGVVFAFLTGWFSILGLPAAITGLVLSCVGGKKLKMANQPSGIATAGLVVGIVATVFAAISFFTCGICILCVEAAEAGVSNAANDFVNSLM